MSKPKLKKSYVIGYGYPEYWRNGLLDGVYFYSDRDTRVSNNRDTHWPEEINQVHRSKRPHYELILRQCSPKKRASKRKSRRHTNTIRSTWKRFLKSI